LSNFDDERLVAIRLEKRRNDRAARPRATIESGVARAP
jgi:hypothetical protein